MVFREVRGKFDPQEIVQIKNNLDNVRFELRNIEEYDSDELNESNEEVEQPI